MSLLTDIVIMETILSDRPNYKKASIVDEIAPRIVNYFKSKIDPNDPAGSVLDEIAPGALWIAFQAIGLGKWGMFIGLLMNVFHINVHGLLESIYDEVKPLISSGSKLSSSQIDAAVNKAVAAHSGSSNTEEIHEGFNNLNKKSMLQEARIISLGMIEYENQLLRLTKEAGFTDFMRNYNKNKNQGGSILGKIFGTIIKIALASAGLMVAGDIINSFLGRPNSLDNTYQAGKEKETTDPIVPVATQTKYPVKGDAPIPASLNITNSKQNIESVVLQFAKDVYSGLDGKENLIMADPTFQFIAEKIAFYNEKSKGYSTVYMPPYWKTKKQLVDNFIDEVAKQDKSA